MTSRSRAFQVKIIGDVADANKALQSMDGKVSKFSKVMGGLAKGMAAAFAVKQVFDFGKAMVDRAEEMGSLYAITNQIVEQTGGIANKTADDIKTLNRELSLRTGIDKALITQGSNVLLTFKGIRDEVGAGNDIFSRANGLMLDMSTVFGGDASSAAVQLGKALEDPIKGISALTRVGVTFTDQQKDQIEAMVASGDMLGAQKMILEAIEGQVGGTAEASADATAKITNAWREVQEWIGEKILPILDKLATWIWEVGIPAFEKFAKWITDMWNRITGIFKGGTDEQLGTVKNWVGKIVEYYTALRDMVMAIIERFVVIATYVWKNYGEQITAVMKVAWSNVKAIIDLILGVVINLVKLVTAIFKGDWSAAWAAAKGIVMAFWDFFKGIPGRMVDALRAAVGLVGAAATNLGKAIVNGIIGFWNKLDPRITIGPMPSWLPGVGGKKWTSPDLLPDLPQLASGGIVTSPTIAMIGEAGPEAVIPLGSKLGFGGPNITVIVNASPGADLAAAGRQIVDAIVAHERYAGQGWRAKGATA
jgi:hypothetical protein